MHVEIGIVKFWVTGINLCKTLPPAYFCFPTRTNIFIKHLEKKIWNYTNWTKKTRFFQILSLLKFCVYIPRGITNASFHRLVVKRWFNLLFIIFCSILPYHVILNKQGFLFNLYVHVFTCHVSEECFQHNA